MTEPFGVVDAITLGDMTRPNQLEFVENGNGKAVYVGQARVDDSGPGSAPGRPPLRV